MTPEQFMQSWRIRGTDKSSTVYRYTNQKHIDSFFNEGILKLSSFNGNRTIENDIRQDKNEGTHSYRLVSRDRSDECELIVNDLDVRRMLCCSTEYNPNFYLPYFKVDGCFEITNTFGFGYEVSKALNEFDWGQEGKVEYRDDQHTYFLLENHLELLDLPKNAKFTELLPYMDKIGRNDLDMFFHKILRHKPENEFRIVWKCKLNHDLYIKCLGARRFCKRIT